MKMVICFDTEDDKGMENAIKMMDHLARDYLNRRVYSPSDASFGKIEFIKVLRIFAANIAKEHGLGLLSEDKNTPRPREDWEGLKFAKVFADKVYKLKEGGRRIGSAGAPSSNLKN